MIKTEQTRGADVVVMAEDSIYGAIGRTKEYGPLKTLAVNAPIVLGLVCEYNGAKVIVRFGKKIEVIPAHKAEKSIKALFRSRNYNNEFANLDLQDSAMAMFANPEQYKLLQKETKGNIGGIIIYILTSSRVRYPVSFADFTFKIKDLLSEINGYDRIM